MYAENSYERSKMRACKSAIICFAALLIAGATLLATNINVTVSLTSAGSINDGVDYVLPYQLSIDGLAVAPDCYDFFDRIQLGQTWQANEWTLNDAAAQPNFSIADFSNSLFAEAIPTPGSSLAQAFVIQAPLPNNGGEDAGSGPEPGTLVLLSIGLALICISKAWTEKALLVHQYAAGFRRGDQPIRVILKQKALGDRLSCGCLHRRHIS